MAREQFGQAPAKRIDCPIELGPSDGSRFGVGDACNFAGLCPLRNLTLAIFGKQDSFVKLLSNFNSR